MKPIRPQQRGTTLLEVLVTMVIVAFGLLGVAAFQSKAQVGSIESYQRAQAIILLEDMSARLQANAAKAADYVGTYGIGDSQPASCGSLSGAARDLCEWSGALKGSAEASGSSKLGAMIGARGCITQVSPANPATGVCTPAVYQVAVSWQGLHATQAPSLSCANGSYGNETNRRTIGARVTIALTSCS